MSPIVFFTIATIVVGQFVYLIFRKQIRAVYGYWLSVPDKAVVIVEALLIVILLIIVTLMLGMYAW